uniref:Uncharacterized protein n=1 Tax=Oryza brachyantha TaxID=4533 RepID=J3LGR5_ORYBR
MKKDNFEKLKRTAASSGVNFSMLISSNLYCIALPLKTSFAISTLQNFCTVHCIVLVLSMFVFATIYSVEIMNCSLTCVLCVAMALFRDI